MAANESIPIGTSIEAAYESMSSALTGLRETQLHEAFPEGDTTDEVATATQRQTELDETAKKLGYAVYNAILHQRREARGGRL